MKLTLQCECYQPILTGLIQGVKNELLIIPSMNTGEKNPESILKATKLFLITSQRFIERNQYIYFLSNSKYGSKRPKSLLCLLSLSQNQQLALRAQLET